MQRTNVLSYLEDNIASCSDKLSFCSDERQMTFKEVYDESIRLGHRFFMENNDLVIELRYDLNKYSEELYKKIAEDMKKSLFNL